MQESKTFCTNFLRKVAIDLDGILYTIETCRCDEPHTHFMISHVLKSQGKEPYLYDFEKKPNTLV